MTGSECLSYSVWSSSSGQSSDGGMVLVVVRITVASNKVCHGTVPHVKYCYAAAVDDDVFADPRLTAMGLVIEVFEGMRDRLSAVHAAHGLSGNDFDVLIRLARSPGRRLRMSDLAAQTGLSTSGMTRVVDRLERSGLACRGNCADDRRGSAAVLTDAGADRLQADVGPLIETIEQWFTGRLTPDELDAFLATLRKLRTVVRPEATAGGTG